MVDTSLPYHENGAHHFIRRRSALQYNKQKSIFNEQTKQHEDENRIKEQHTRLNEHVNQQ